MLVDKVFVALLAVARGILDVLPAPTWPDWMGTANTTTPGFSTLAGMGAYVGDKMTPFSGWFNLRVLFTGIGLLGGIKLSLVALRVLRRMISTITGGGGVVDA